ncbi:MAG TPA: hypothetical protein VGP41_16260 [Candidatus Lustribacter sp.]|nr:hypothetical protein [Candidatus Lustribacter sp.]
MAAFPTGSFAQQTPDAPPMAAPAPPPPAAPVEVPSYARPTGDETITGRIVSFDGAYALAVRDDRGFIDNVRMRQGTIINPTGITLATGMSVTIHGVNTGSTFAANQIDTPYNSYGFAYPAYPPYAVYPYPYPYYGYPYGWGRVSIGIGFGFGWGGYRRW